MDLAVHKVIRNRRPTQYEILRELGRGGMGGVYLDKNKLMDRLEVLKVVNKTLLHHPGAGGRVRIVERRKHRVRRLPITARGINGKQE